MTNDELPTDLAKRIAEMEDDESIDFESDQRQADGWFKQYIECPECHVPMARSTVISEDIDIHTGHSFTRSAHRGICPNCKEVASLMRVDRLTAEFGRIESLAEPEPDVYAGMLHEIESHCRENGWDSVAIEVESLRDKVHGLGQEGPDYNCLDCDYEGPMSQPMQTMDMPMVMECPSCGSVENHQVMNDE